MRECKQLGMMRTYELLIDFLVGERSKLTEFIGLTEGSLSLMFEAQDVEKASV